MIIPVLNMDVTPAVQLMITISYIALVYGLSVEITGDHPFGRELNTPYVFEERQAGRTLLQTWQLLTALQIELTPETAGKGMAYTLHWLCFVFIPLISNFSL